MRFVAALLLCITFPGWVCAQKGCRTLTKELYQLRLQYHRLVNNRDAKTRAGFDELVEVLDKIVDLKNQMRKSNCEIPLRPKKFE
jgi:hypothetical protein